LASPDARHDDQRPDGNNVLGTPAYMSPEQFDVIRSTLRPVQPAVVLFEALTGRLPFTEGANVLMVTPSGSSVAAHTLNPACRPPRRAGPGADRAAARYPTVSVFVHERAATYHRGRGAFQAAAQPSSSSWRSAAGVEAYSRRWGTAAAFLGRVVAIDGAYRDAAQLRQAAVERLKDKRDTPPKPPLPAH
jgi:serine/threonine protein kinase